MAAFPIDPAEIGGVTVEDCCISLTAGHALGRSSASWGAAGGCRQRQPVVTLKRREKLSLCGTDLAADGGPRRETLPLCPNPLPATRIAHLDEAPTGAEVRWSCRMTAAAIVRPDNVAVVTGAALGIGRAMCERFAEAAMSVVLADLPGKDLDSAVRSVKAVHRGLTGSSEHRLMSPTRSRFKLYAIRSLPGSTRSTSWSTTRRPGSGVDMMPTSPNGESNGREPLGANSGCARLSANYVGLLGTWRDRQCRVQAGDHQPARTSDLQYDEGGFEDLYGNAPA